MGLSRVHLWLITEGSLALDVCRVQIPPPVAVLLGGAVTGRWEWGFAQHLHKSDGDMSHIASRYCRCGGSDGREAGERHETS